MCLFVFMGSLACGEGDNTIDIVYDPCELTVLAPAEDAHAQEVESVRAAIASWEAVAPVRLDLRLPGTSADDAELSSSGLADVSSRPTPAINASQMHARSLPIIFENAAPMFFGLYRDERGDIVINRRMEDIRERAVTVSHELGHAMGLFHVGDVVRRSVMNPNNQTRFPTLEDGAALMELWGDCTSRAAVHSYLPDSFRLEG